MKICTKCNIEKPLEDFYRFARAKDGRQSHCKECDSLSSKEYWQRGILENRNRNRRNGLRYHYGITEEQYEELLKKQNYSCAICKKSSSEEYRRLSVDHCHDKTEINYRGLLCTTCNTGLGQFKDNIDTLQSAIKYLKQYKEN